MVTSSPVAVALRRRVGDVAPRHQQEGSRHVDDAAEGQEQEGGVERDSLLIQNLEKSEGVI